MTGLAKKPRPKLEEKARSEVRDRPTKAERDEYFDEGYRWIDTSDLRNKAFYCTHHQHSLVRAADLLTFYGFTWEQFEEHTPDRLKEWWDDGQPTVTHNPPKFNSFILPPDDNTPQIPEYYLEGYNPCATCLSYVPDIASTGAGLPHKGSCTKDVGRKGALSILDKGARPTFNFLSCIGHQLEPNRIRDRQHRPANLLAHAELNPMSEDVSALVDFYAWTPRAYREKEIEDEELEELAGMDLVRMTHARVDTVDTTQFIRDLGAQSVIKHFALRVKEGSAHEQLHWSRFIHYDRLGNSLYGPVDLESKSQIPEVIEEDDEVDV